MLRDGDIIFLLGAGCSAGAKIPTAAGMLADLHLKLKTEPTWKQHHELYCKLRGLVLMADARLGRFADAFDIERLVASLSEIEERGLNLLNPFVGALHQDLATEMQKNPTCVSEFREQLMQQLKDWVQIPRYEDASYYRSLYDFQAEYTYPVRVFTLNYDTCLEHHEVQGRRLERGFDPSTGEWDGQRFDPPDDRAVAIFYYKMHGSIDWERTEGNVLREIKKTPAHPDLIFGTLNKLYPQDPYLLYAYELRKYSLQSRCIVAIGYSFQDEHINRILRQALERNRDRRLLAISPGACSDSIDDRIGGLCGAQVLTVDARAEDYMPGMVPSKIVADANLRVEEPEDPFAEP